MNMSSFPNRGGVTLIWRFTNIRYSAGRSDKFARASGIMMKGRLNPLLGVTRNIHPGKQTATCGSKLQKPNRGKLSTSASDSNIATLIGSGSLISISFSMYILKQGFLDGRAGLRFAFLKFWYFRDVRLKIVEARRTGKPREKCIGHKLDFAV